MGLWAQRWSRSDLVADENLDPDLLMWAIRSSVTAEGMPEDRRFTVRFEFPGVPSNRRRYWIVFDRGEADRCAKDPGFEVDLYLSAKLRSLVEVWLGHVSLDRALRAGDIDLEGSRQDLRRFRVWLARSLFAEAGRQPPGTKAARS